MDRAPASQRRRLSGEEETFVDGARQLLVVLVGGAQGGEGVSPPGEGIVEPVHDPALRGRSDPAVQGAQRGDAALHGPPLAPLHELDRLVPARQRHQQRAPGTAVGVDHHEGALGIREAEEVLVGPLDPGEGQRHLRELTHPQPPDRLSLLDGQRGTELRRPGLEHAQRQRHQHLPGLEEGVPGVGHHRPLPLLDDPDLLVQPDIDAPGQEFQQPQVAALRHQVVPGILVVVVAMTERDALQIVPEIEGMEAPEPGEQLPLGACRRQLVGEGRRDGAILPLPDLLHRLLQLPEEQLFRAPLRRRRDQLPLVNQRHPVPVRRLGFHTGLPGQLHQRIPLVTVDPGGPQVQRGAHRSIGPDAPADAAPGLQDHHLLAGVHEHPGRRQPRHPGAEDHHVQGRGRGRSAGRGRSRCRSGPSLRW